MQFWALGIAVLYSWTKVFKMNKREFVNLKYINVRIAPLME
jgi:hypothetical protein